MIVTSKTHVAPLSFAPPGKKAYQLTLVSGYDNELGPSVDAALMTEYIAQKSYIGFPKFS